MPKSLILRLRPRFRKVQQFDADSAYLYVARQLEFGPRVPGSDAQKACAEWLQNELARHGAKVYVQNTEAKAYDGTTLPIINIIGSYNPEAKTRVLLMSHWDCRPMSDADPDKSKYHNPVDGANDGASGVGVLLELARQAGLKNLKWVSISSFAMLKTMVRQMNSRANTRRNGGLSVHRHGVASLMSMVTVQLTESCSIW